LGVSAGTTGTLSPTSGTVFLQAGTLAGSGQILGSLTVGSATVVPGFSPGSLAIAGNLNMSSGSTLSMELGGTTTGSSDTLVVSGNANLAGSLTLSSYNGFAPTATDQFTLIDAGSVTGTFAQSQTTGSLLGGLSFSQLQMSVAGVTGGIPSTTVLFTPVIDLGSQTTDPLPDLTSTVVDAGSVTNTQLAPPSYNPTATVETTSTTTTPSTAPSTAASPTTTNTTDTSSTSTNPSSSSSTSTTTTSTAAASTDQTVDASSSGLSTGTSSETSTDEDPKKAEEDKKKAASSTTNSGDSTPAPIAPTPTAVASNTQTSSAPVAPTAVRTGEVASLGIEPEPTTNVTATPSGNKEVTYAPAKPKDDKGSDGKAGTVAADEKC
jgi:hypothetical protein